MTDKVDNVNDRITKLEIETKTGFDKLNSKFGIVEEQNTTANKRVDKLEAELKEQKAEIKKLEQSKEQKLEKSE